MTGVEATTPKAGPPHQPLAVAARLDAQLGDPHDPGTLFSYARCAELDDVDEFPTDICRRLDELGLPGYYVPARHGGRLTDYETVLQVMRMVARRDITVAVAHGTTYLGAVSGGVGGDAGRRVRDPGLTRRLPADR
jgi:alkylation response protein AidB-like acyl-CoA dehydrogenase